MESNSVGNRTKAGVRFVSHGYGQHHVLLPINQNYDKIRETNKPSIERWTILKRRYEAGWKTQQFTQQSALQQRPQNDSYCPITSMTGTVQLIVKSVCWWPITVENFLVVLIMTNKGDIKWLKCLHYSNISALTLKYESVNPQCLNNTSNKATMTKHRKAVKKWTMYKWIGKTLPR